MKVIQAILGSLYRIWFYIWVGVVILILLPALTISISRKSWYPFFFKLARVWARMILYGMGLFPKVRFDQKLKKGANYILVANHTSMTDIMLMLHVSSVPFVFVGKKELAALPLFGYFYKRTCILVDRNNARSKHGVYQASKERLEAGLSVCIFPEGGIPDNPVDLVDHFKDGAFRMAIEHQIPVIPMTFYDNKKRLPDTFYIGGPGKLRVRVHKPVSTVGLANSDRLSLRDDVRNTILRDLQEDRN
ncbi:lysophospholipid acyltransferase family protein [Aureitalea marina]|uniref:1-acyl-sn-glycerol-3-phosphate acyltransferase n=1 Tax=Aureitalea marina TaxID=930804 RepID=A0A2S7KSB9_9FLAO|nr:lysophospholipid acyltransferase family protein [Aureitalea marina]PQB05521.1 1-acyl-sn-glycerol-3-phosphate acyltransferase [Aureitalea marina]